MSHQCTECSREFDSEHGLRTHHGRMHGASTTSCSNCGDTIHRQPSDMERFTDHFCDWECKREFRRAGQEVPCDWCGDPVYKSRRDLQRNDTHFCGRRCYGQYRSATALPQFSLEAGNGYPRWHLGENDNVSNIAVHQLVVIADGSDPGRVFDDQYNVHHENGCTLDNRPSNLSVVEISEHGRRDGGKRVNRYSWMDLLYVVEFFLIPQKRSTHIETQ